MATVDSLGEITGHAPGRTTVAATIGGITGEMAVEVSPVPRSVALVAGGNQRSPAGEALAEPIVMQVLSRAGRPVQGATVRFGPADGGGVDLSTGATDSLGRVRTHWTLGASPGPQRLIVTADGIDSTLAVVAEADPVAANTRATTVGDVGGALVGHALPAPVAIRVADSADHALADIPIRWTVLNGGTITDASERTDANGIARARWTLGGKAGDQRLEATIGHPRTGLVYGIVAKADAPVVAKAAAKAPVATKTPVAAKAPAASKAPAPAKRPPAKRAATTRRKP